MKLCGVITRKGSVIVFTAAKISIFWLAVNLTRKSCEIERFFDMTQAMKIGAQDKCSGRICSDGTEFLGFVQTGS
jgi:hypothetical protein